MDEVTKDVGCEAYLYNDMLCCLHPCPVISCPEPICALDFPGGAKGLQRYKQVKTLLEEGVSMDEIAKRLSLQKQTVKRRLDKALQ